MPQAIETAHQPIVIGNIQLANRVVLAPMSGVTDLPFRRLVARLGLPVLTVRGKAETPYRNILVATDLSDPSRRA